MFSKNPFFCFGALSAVILVFLLLSPLPKGQDGSFLAFYPNHEAKAELFFNQEVANPLEASQLLFFRETSLQGASPVYLFHSQSLASLFGQEERKEIEEYVVKKGDTIWSIAKKFGISSQTIIWANDLKTSQLRVGQKLTILPVDGVLYLVKKGDCLEDIARRYNADPQKIAEFNNIKEGSQLFLQELLIIPGGKMPSRVRTADKTPVRISKSSPFKNYYPWGYCTWWVAHKRPIPRYWGNAIDWLKSAKRDGFKVCEGSTCPPKAGAVISLRTSHPLGHVAYVEQVEGDTLVISEMNYGKFGRMNWRRLKVGDPRIRGYIY